MTRCWSDKEVGAPSVNGRSFAPTDTRSWTTATKRAAFGASFAATATPELDNFTMIPCFCFELWSTSQLDPVRGPRCRDSHGPQHQKQERSHP